MQISMDFALFSDAFIVELTCLTNKFLLKK